MKRLRFLYGRPVTHKPGRQVVVCARCNVRIECSKSDFSVKCGVCEEEFLVKPLHFRMVGVMRNSHTSNVPACVSVCVVQSGETRQYQPYTILGAFRRFQQDLELVALPRMTTAQAYRRWTELPQELRMEYEAEVTREWEDRVASRTQAK
jgi:hypothetical protein